MRWLSHPAGWLLGLLLSLPAMAGAAQTASVEIPRAESLTQPLPVKPYTPPQEDSIAEDAMGEMIRFGRDVFVDTQRHAARYVDNGLQCANCHLDAGRLVNSAPLWAAWINYPAYRDKNKQVNTMEQRIQGCFKYSMNGVAPPTDSDVMKGLMSYAHWLAQGAPTGVNLPGRGYPDLPEPPKAPDLRRGAQVYADNCALCHGEDGQGTRVSKRHGHGGDRHYHFPPLWGPDSFNWGAGMHRINTAAAFIRANMPLGKGGSLSLQDAWDVASYITAQPRPQDPRYTGNLDASKAKFHDHQCHYAETVDGRRLGQGAAQN